MESDAETIRRLRGPTARGEEVDFSDDSYQCLQKVQLNSSD